jgi:inosine/xanthosine triphosphatase
MKKVVLASTNPVKQRATLQGFQKMFPDETFEVVNVDVPSEVNAQPMGNEETLAGALNRAWNAVHAVEEADYWVGIEGGIEEQDCELAAFAWIVICTRKRVGKSRTGSFTLPQAVSDLVRQGKELGDADDIVFKRFNSKRANGAVGILTDDAVDRVQLYEPSVIMALIPFKNYELYPDGC